LLTVVVDHDIVTLALSGVTVIDSTLPGFVRGVFETVVEYGPAPIELLARIWK
jgi:hypothetical protein